MAAPKAEPKRGKGVDPAAVEGIAAELGETDALPQMLIKRIVRTLGEERTRQLVRHAKVVEEQGGMLLPDGSRRRTLGGVFFKLAKDTASPQERARIWIPKNRRPKPKTTANETTDAPAAS